MRAAEIFKPEPKAGDRLLVADSVRAKVDTEHFASGQSQIYNLLIFPSVTQYAFGMSCGPFKQH